MVRDWEENRGEQCLLDLASLVVEEEEKKGCVKIPENFPSQGLHLLLKTEHFSSWSLPTFWTEGFFSP